MPEGYRGVVVEKKEAPEPQAPRPDEPEVIDVDSEDVIPLGSLETQAEFDEMVIWGHESIAEASSDPYIRGVDEWVKLSEQVCLVYHQSFGLDLLLMLLLDTFVRRREGTVN